MATHSSVLAWRIPGTGEPGGLLSMGFSQSRTRLKRLSSSSSIHLNVAGRGRGNKNLIQFSSITRSCLTLCDHKSQHARPPCPSPTPRVYSNSRPSSRWCHPAILSSVVPFSSCPQSLPASESFPMSQLFTWVLLVGHNLKSKPWPSCGFFMLPGSHICAFILLLWTPWQPVYAISLLNPITFSPILMLI